MCVLCIILCVPSIGLFYVLYRVFHWFVFCCVRHWRVFCNIYCVFHPLVSVVCVPLVGILNRFDCAIGSCSVSNLLFHDDALVGVVYYIVCSVLYCVFHWLVFSIMLCMARHDICQKIYTSIFRNNKKFTRIKRVNRDIFGPLI